ncbi:MAG: MlaE family lipid ABC transporter permease subunit [Calditrichaceae bacterium]|jgi:phospholipid/cholesterol/gamma-HCH transport system permease protein
MKINNSRIRLPESLTFKNAGDIFSNLLETLIPENHQETITLDFNNVNHLDSAGASVVNKFILDAENDGFNIQCDNINPRIEHILSLFKVEKIPEPAPKQRIPFLEKTGDLSYHFYKFLKDFLLLLSDLFYWSIISIYKPKLRRSGETIRQSIFVGVNALPIIALIAFLIGFILALQSAAQLRQFGASIYVADLVAVAMVTEMGPLITAIMVAGRSGSAIAAEIANMVVSEEIDSLNVMGIDPVPYLLVPKLIAILFTLPMLTLFANVIGIFGGLIIGVTYLDLSVIPFINEVVSVLRYKEFITALIKSITFAFIILLTGAYFGLHVRGGSEGVGRATTTSVVVSIFLVILADSIIGLIFYFGEPAF